MDRTAVDEVPHPKAHKANMSRPGGKASPRVAELSEDEAKALSLRIQGRTFQQIAEAMGVGRTTAYDMVTRALARADEALAEKAAEHRELEAQRLDVLLGALWPVASGARSVVPSAPDDDPSDVAFEARVKAIDRALKVMERRAKLLGLDAPIRSEVSGPDGGAVPIEVARAALIKQLGGGDPPASGGQEPG